VFLEWNCQGFVDLLEWLSIRGWEGRPQAVMSSAQCFQRSSEGADIERRTNSRSDGEVVSGTLGRNLLREPQ
jgi:hypothetical protein